MQANIVETERATIQAQLRQMIDLQAEIVCLTARLAEAEKLLAAYRAAFRKTYEKTFKIGMTLIDKDIDAAVLAAGGGDE